jgi:multidrug efflux pump subunit AcrA (membrane-fusion protein)
VDSLVAQLHEAQARWSAAESASAALQLRVQAEQEAHRETTARLEAMVTKVQSETAAEATAAAAARAQLEHASVSYGAASEKHARAISSMQAKLDAAAAELRDMSASLVNSEKRAREQQAAEKERSAAERHQLMTDLAERVRLVGQREAGMNSALAKVMAAEEAMEACITCMACMEVLHEPTTCTPCGHTYCAACLKAQEGGGGDYKLAVCPECDGPAGKVVSVGLLGMLTAKFCYQKQTLAELKAGAAATAAVSKFAGLVQKVVP